MQYRINPRNGDKLSALGFGCMRFARDARETERQVVRAIELGVNYFDTAYIYPGNEEALGRILRKGYRDQVKVATKLPPYLVRKTEDFERIFTTELRRLRTDHIDYYFMHMLQSPREWERLTELGVQDWLARKQESGQIVNVGFSYHGGLPDFKALVDVWDWGFCMLQFNYYDENSQAGVAGVEYAAAMNMAVMAMEPLRGGRLASLPKEARAVFDGGAPGRSPAEWALRWVWNHPQILVALSGMNTLEMVEENVRVASEAMAGALTEAELALFAQARDILRAKTYVPCTGCNYCMPCPQGVDIPMCFSLYNESATGGTLMTKGHYVLRTNGHNASRCVDCGLCEKHCPQKIAIRAELKNVAGKLESFPYAIARRVAGRFMRMQ